MIASAQTLRRRMPIFPFHERTACQGMTFGLGPAGYDVRIAESFILWSKQFKLASTIERFDTPLDMTFKVEDKSTWARRGLSLFNTTGEPGWRGYLTLELVNQSWRPIRFRRGMPIAQIVFHLLDEPTGTPYAGRYQHQQAGAQPARYLRNKS
jgi:dCTP deaminase